MIYFAPCPFCGTIPVYDEDEQVGSAVTCKVCKTDGPWANGQESHISIERWNTRQENK
jgi:Lar family restriction alleviation protein